MDPDKSPLVDGWLPSASVFLLVGTKNCCHTNEKIRRTNNSQGHKSCSHTQNANWNHLLLPVRSEMLVILEHKCWSLATSVQVVWWCVQGSWWGQETYYISNLIVIKCYQPQHYTIFAPQMNSKLVQFPEKHIPTKHNCVLWVCLLLLSSKLPSSCLFEHMRQGRRQLLLPICMAFHRDTKLRSTKVFPGTWCLKWLGGWTPWSP